MFQENLLHPSKARQSSLAAFAVVLAVVSLVWLLYPAPLSVDGCPGLTVVRWPASVAQCSGRAGDCIDNLLSSEWMRRQDQGLLPTIAMASRRQRTMRLAGGTPLLLMFNPTRAHKRQTAVSHHTSDGQHLLLRPFSDTDFNFDRVGPSELLFYLDITMDTDRWWSRSSVFKVECVHQFGENQAPAHEVYVNLFPLGPSSSIVAPFRSEHRPQYLTLDALLVGLSISQHFSSPWLRVGFNSLSAGASVNHLHFQVWDFPALLPCELSSTFPVGNLHHSLSIRRSNAYPVKFLRFDLSASTSNDPEAQSYLAQTVFSLVERLYLANQPFNVIMTPATVFLFPRQPMIPLGSIRVGFPEVAGEIFISDESQYRELNELDMAEFFRNHVDSSEEVFNSLLEHIRTKLQAWS